MLDLDEVSEELGKSIAGAKSPEGREELEEHRRKLGKLREIARKKERTREDVAEAMCVTCFKNLGYCCGLEKPCLWRDGCMVALHIDDETYIRAKEKIVWEMLKKL